jgi:Putative beta-barrel porin-2, OmpL-like. bbp2
VALRRVSSSIVVLATFTLGVRLCSAQSAPADTQLGPVLPENIKLPPNPLTNWTVSHELRFFGWANGGYTWSSSGQGLLEIEPRANRFGDALLLNQAALVVERTLSPGEWSWGFRSEFYMGADAALLRPVDGFGPTTPRFGTDFRQAFFSFHAPVLTDGGVDFKFGRQYVPLGYDTTMAPYRPMYSQSYVWLYSQNGATTGAIATIHVNPSLDVIAGVTLGVNSLFNLRGRAPCYIARALYWLDSDKRTKLVGTFYTGPEPIAAAKGHIGNWQTEVEAQLIRDVNRRLTLVSETNLGWDTRDPANNLHTSKWYGTYAMGILHLHRLLDVNSRAEWFHDVDGSRTGMRANYGEITTGVNFMPSTSARKSDGTALTVPPLAQPPRRLCRAISGRTRSICW